MFISAAVKMMTMTMTMTTTEITAHQTAGSNLVRLLSAVLCGFMLMACGITAPRHSEGYAELESLGVFDVDRKISFSIGPTLLRFAARHIDDDPEIVALLRGLDGVRIRVYEIDGDATRVASRMRRMNDHLQADGWESVILMREQNQEEMHLLLKSRHGSIRGLTLLTSDGEAEAVVINLMGEIEPARFSDVMLALEIDAPGALDVQPAVAGN